MNSLAAYMSRFLETVRNVIELDPPELPEWSDELPDSTALVTKTYMLPDLTVEGIQDGEEIEISFYADSSYNMRFYAFVGTDIEEVAELNDGSDPTFGDIGGFRIYLDGEE